MLFLDLAEFANKQVTTESRVRWMQKGPPITDFSQVPQGWPAEDHDIHEDDVVANIQRCKDRIKEGVMPHWWERRLKKYEECKTQLDTMMAAAPAGLSMAKAGDKLKLTATIGAIVKAYQSGKLTWHEGMVTYWSRGKKICNGPKEFAWEDFDRYNRQYKGYEEFWVEGLYGPGSVPVLPIYALGMHNSCMSVMVIYQDDLERLEDKAREMARIVGAVRLYGAFGGSWAVIYKMEVNMKNHNGECMLDWTPIQVAVVDWDRRVGEARLSGPWMRHRFFVGSSPDNQGILCVAKNKTLFKQMIEPIPQSEIIGVPANMKLFNAPGRVFGHYRGHALPGLSPEPDDYDLAVQYWNYTNLLGETSGSTSKRTGGDGP
ncbi:hypothetical protein N7470_009914 [Penicillium chermesinum]|nr:hypothetical protein N7470_009914 [Penicillium chermesinum]